jgi:adenosylcobinamide-GDP ribazoletransferase
MPDENPSDPPAVAPQAEASREAAERRPWNWLGEIRIALVFLTILPLRLRPNDLEHSVAHAVRAFPIAGIIVGGAGALAYTIADFIGSSSTVSALLALGAMVAISGAMHEDGLADFCDGLGGRTREQRLAIMRDSAIGSFGVIALVLTLSLRAAAIAQCNSAFDAGSAMLGAAILSRGMMPPAMYLLPQARRDGLAAAAGVPDRGRTIDAVMIGCLLAMLAISMATHWFMVFVVLAGGALGTLLPAVVARRRLGGQTGDVIGAVQQGSEIGFLLLFVAYPPWLLLS